MKPIAILACLLVAGCTHHADDFIPGYAEGEYVRIASPIAGTLAKVYVKAGDKVAADAPAFVLEQESERAERAEAQSRVQRAQSQLADVRKGKRPDELAAARAQLAQAQADRALSAAALARQQKLIDAHFIAPAQLDVARSAVARDQARVNELQAQLRVAQLGARSDEIDAAAQDQRAAEAQLAQASWKVDQKLRRIPLAGDVTEVFFREGELVPAGSPVVSMLPPENIKARFFVTEPVVGSLALGQQVSLRCDGCGEPIAATISFIARSAEFTSPVIYSKENRASLVFLVEARPAPQQARRLHPGQPLEVRLGARAP